MNGTGPFEKFKEGCDEGNTAGAALLTLASRGDVVGVVSVELEFIAVFDVDDDSSVALEHLPDPQNPPTTAAIKTTRKRNDPSRTNRANLGTTCVGVFSGSSSGELSSCTVVIDSSCRCVGRPSNRMAEMKGIVV